MKKLSLLVAFGLIFVIGCQTNTILSTYELETAAPMIGQNEESISSDSNIKLEPATPTPVVEVNPGGPYPFEQHARIVEDWYNTIDVYRLDTLPNEYGWANEYGDFDFFHLDNGYTVLVFDSMYETQIKDASSKFASDNNLEYIIVQGGKTTAIFATKDLWHIHSSWIGVTSLYQKMQDGQIASDMILINPENWEIYVKENH